QFLGHAAAGAATLALPASARAEVASQPPKHSGQAEHTVTEPAAIEVNARSIPAFEPRDRARTRFGALEYRSGLVLTSSYRGFGRLSGIRFLDTKGERFIAISDQGAWFSGNIRYSGRSIAGLDNVEAAPILNAEGRPITEKRFWYDTESIALDGSFAYVGLE